MKKDGNLTAALNALSTFGLKLEDVLDPDRQRAVLLCPGIGRRQLARLREHAAQLQGPTLTQVEVMLPQDILDQARSLGQGNIALGIQLAVSLATRARETLSQTLVK